MPFLTAVDSRAKIKGSRDPLGIQPIWTRLGRKVVGNLTTVSTSVRDFTVLMWGLWLIERAQAQGWHGREADLFLRWEQLADYVRRHVNKEPGIRGIDRVDRNLAATGGRVTLSAQADHQILSDQLTYGLWGLYTGPARVSGLVEADRLRLTPKAAEFLEQHDLPLLKTAGASERSLLNLVMAEEAAVDLAGSYRSLADALAQLLQWPLRPADRQFYREHLVFGGSGDRTHGVQRRLAELMLSTPKEEPIGPQLVLQWRIAAAASGDAIGAALAVELQRIADAEAVLAVADAVFGWSLGCDQAPVGQLAAILQNQWGSRVGSVKVDGFHQLEGDLLAATRSPQVAHSWQQVAQGLDEGHYVEVIQSLALINRVVMQARGGASWVEVRGDTWVVRQQTESGKLPKHDQLSELWTFPYFLGSLRQVARDCAEVP